MVSQQLHSNKQEKRFNSYCCSHSIVFKPQQTKPKKTVASNQNLRDRNGEKTWGETKSGVDPVTTFPAIGQDLN